MRTQAEPIKVFISYAPQDEEHLVELEKHLALLRKEGLIETWHARKVAAGDDWRGTMDVELESARIILLLVSSDFIASDYCFDLEMEKALGRHARGGTNVIPIIIRPCYWRNYALAKLAPIPRNGRAVTTWPNRDEAWEDVALGVRDAVEIVRRESKATPCVDEPHPPAVSGTDERPGSFRVETRPLKHAVVLDEQMFRRLCAVFQTASALTIRVWYGDTEYESANADNVAAALREHHDVIRLVVLRAGNVSLSMDGRRFGSGLITYSVHSDKSAEMAYKLLYGIEEAVRSAAPRYDFVCQTPILALVFLLGGSIIQAGARFGVGMPRIDAYAFGWATTLFLLVLGRLWLWPKVKFSFSARERER
jgi:hypothetical protein